MVIKIPVVFIDSLPLPLNETNLLESREKTDSSNFAFIPSAAEDTIDYSTTQHEDTQQTQEKPAAETPIMKNTKGTPPKLHQFQGLTRESPVYDSVQPGQPNLASATTRTNQPGWTALNPTVPRPSGGLSDEYYVESEAQTFAESAGDDPMDDQEDDDLTVVSANLSVVNRTQDSTRAERGVVAMHHSTFAAAASASPLSNKPRALFHDPNPPMERPLTSQSWIRTQMSTVLGRAAGSNQGAHAGRSEGGGYTAQTQEASSPKNAPPLSHAESQQSREKDFLAILAKMNSDHRDDIDLQKYENIKLRGQIAELQQTITQLIRTLEQVKAAPAVYDTTLWDDDVDASATPNTTTPVKRAQTPPMTAVTRQQLKGGVSPSKNATASATAAVHKRSPPPAQTNRSDSGGKKKACISTSPQTKFMNQYQALVDEAEDNEGRHQLIELINTDDDQQAENTAELVQHKDVHDQNSAHTSDELLETSFGTVPDDSASFDDVDKEFPLSEGKEANCRGDQRH